MNIIFLLIPLGLILMGVAIWAFFWAINNDQYSDLERQAHEILFDQDENEE